MHHIIRIYFAALLVLIAPRHTGAATAEATPAEWIAAADAICFGTVFGNQAFVKSNANGIYTATSIRVQQTFKGVFAGTVQVEHRGGAFGGRGEDYCGRPVFAAGQTYLLFIRQRDDGTLYCEHDLAEPDPGFAEALTLLEAAAPSATGLDVSAQQAPLFAPMAISGLLPAVHGTSSRFPAGDRGEPIEYVVDMDAWPAGVTSNQALAALSSAFEAWTEATSLTFRFAGVESFGMAAADLTRDDGRVYIQMHDNYGYIGGTTTLGRGGRRYAYSSQWPDGGLGGRVGTNEFDLSIQGHLVLKHTKAEMSNLLSLEQVLTHELGHVLSMDHSSEAENEADSELNDATMYYLFHHDGRGAALKHWDTNTVVSAYPVGNTPPYGYDRIIRAVTSPPPQAPFTSGLNQVEFPDLDRQGGAVPLILSSSSGAGTFSIRNSNTIFFTPNNYYGDTEETLPGFFYDSCYIRMSDGVNLSAPIHIRVIQLLADGNSDRQPDSWATLHSIPYGTAQSDPDRDGFTNREEWLLGSDPRDASSNFRISISGTTLSWTSRPYDLYQVQSSTNLADGFSNDWNPIIGTSANQTAPIDSDPSKFYRVQRLK